MKFWTSIELQALPAVFGTGLDDPSLGGFMVYNDPEYLSDAFLDAKEKADEAQAAADRGEEVEEDEFAEYWAFLTFEIPDEEIDEWLTYCMEHAWAIHSHYEMDMEHALEREAPAEEIENIQEGLTLLEDMDNGTKSLAFFDHACLGRVIEPYMINLIDPTTMMEAVYTGERADITTALWQGEATSLTSLNPAFWAWLMMLIGQILAGKGQDTQTTEERDTAAASRKAAARRARRRASGRGKKKKKKRSGAKKGVVTA